MFQLNAKYSDEMLADPHTLPGVPFIDLILLRNDHSFTLQNIKPQCMLSQFFY